MDSRDSPRAVFPYFHKFIFVKFIEIKFDKF